MLNWFGISALRLSLPYHDLRMPGNLVRADYVLSPKVQNHISPYFADVVWIGLSTRHVRMALEGNLSLEELREIWMPISPKPYLSKLTGTGKKSLLVHALYDYSFPPDLSQEVLDDYRKLRIPHSCFKLRCGHYTSGVFPFNVALGYAMCRYIRKNL